MRILFSLDKYQKNEGGADKLAKGVVDSLLSAGHKVYVVEAGGNGESVDSENLQIKSCLLKKSKLIRDNEYTTLKWNTLWPAILEREVDDFKPDLILTQNMLAPASVYVAKKKGIKSVIFFHGYRCIHPLFFYKQDALDAGSPKFKEMPFKYKLKWPLVRKCLELYKSAYRAANMVVANSNYVARVIEKYFSRSAEVLYPVVDMDIPEKRADFDNSKKILFIKPQEIKGVDVLLDVAAVAKNKNFLVVGSASKSLQGRFADCGNIEYLPWTESMEEVYERGSLLFGPSQIPEPFGRVFVEAGLNSIPSVASLAGGIPEAVGLGGELVAMDANAQEWLSAIDKVLDEGSYKEYCSHARGHAEQVLSLNNSHRLLRIINSLF